MPVDIALTSQARELARRHHEALRKVSKVRGYVDLTVAYDELYGLHREAAVAAFEQMLRTWIIWAPSGRGVGIQVEEMRVREQDRQAMRQWVGGTEAENDPSQERRPE